MAEESVSIKQINLDRIRAFMDQEGSVSKSQISRRLGLSFPTVTRLGKRLTRKFHPKRWKDWRNLKSRLFSRVLVRCV